MFNNLHSGLIKPRYYQEDAISALFKFFDEVGGTDAQGKPIDANPVVAMPTGTGKSIVIAEFLRRVFNIHPIARVIMATHVKELISQNAKKLLETWPTAPLGIYSAGLKSSEFIQPIIFGGIQSLVGNGHLFGYRDFLVIDEGHLVSDKDDTSYLKFIEELKAFNPYLKIIMLTATPWRIGMGHLTNGNIATHVAYDITHMQAFNRLIDEGFLSPLHAPGTITRIETAGIGLGANGDFQSNKLQKASDKREITFAALQECIAMAYDRRSWLGFATGVEHAEHIGEMLDLFGISNVVIHSKKDAKTNEKNLERWKRNEVKAAVSMNSLTTGIDNPLCDFIFNLRASMSSSLWVQMLGRGTRPLYAPGFDLETTEGRLAAIQAGGKLDCLVADFAGNTERLGPINDPLIPKPKGKGSPGDAPIKICKEIKKGGVVIRPGCGAYNHTSARECWQCKVDFIFDAKFGYQASNAELIRSDVPQIEDFKVSHATYSRIVKKEDRDKDARGERVKSWIKATYYCGLRSFNELVTVEGEWFGDLHKHNFLSHKGREWFRQRYAGEPPETNLGVIEVMTALRAPSEIKVWVNKKPYPEVKECVF